MMNLYEDNYYQAETALCILEECFNNPRLYTLFQRGEGIGMVRDMCIFAVPVFEAAYNLLIEYYEYDEAFDFEFVPMFANWILEYPGTNIGNALLNDFVIHYEN